MISTKELSITLKHRLSLDSTFCGISKPVIRKENGKYYLAYFVTLFSQDSFRDGLINRPEYIVLTDIEDGEIHAFDSTTVHEFSDSDYSRRFNVELDKTKLYGDFLDETYTLMDKVRESILQGEFDEHDYKIYINRIVNNIPFCYRRFYHELSAL